MANRTQREREQKDETTSSELAASTQGQNPSVSYTPNNPIERHNCSEPDALLVLVLKAREI